MPTTSSAVTRPRRAATFAAVTAAFVTTCLFAPGAVPAAHAEDEKPEPPAKMSTIGGAQLGRPGTQVEPRPGADAPKLPKKLSARSWIVADAESGNVLAAHNAHWELAPASTLKMLFADTVLPKFPKEMEYTVAREDLEPMGEGSSLVGIKEGLSYSVHDMWLGVFLRSGNDAVHALAAMNGGVATTVAEMNAHAKELRALDTHVVSPDGYDKPGQISSAYDLTLIARSGMQKEDFREYASTVRAKFPGKMKKSKKDEKDEKSGESEQGGQDGQGEESEKGEREYFEIQNTNRLLTGDYGLDPYPGIAGVKNGYTSNAGSTFTGVAEKDGRVLLVTVMHPKSGRLEVYKESAKLFDWGFAAAEKVSSVGELVPPAEDVGDDPAGGPGESGTDGDKAPGDSSLASAGPEGADGSGGAGIALGVTGACLVVLAGVVYAVHRRWPLADLSRLRRRPSDLP